MIHYVRDKNDLPVCGKGEGGSLFIESTLDPSRVTCSYCKDQIISELVMENKRVRRSFRRKVEEVDDLLCMTGKSTYVDGSPIQKLIKAIVAAGTSDSFSAEQGRLLIRAMKLTEERLYALENVVREFLEARLVGEHEKAAEATHKMGDLLK